MATFRDAWKGHWQRRKESASERGRRMARARWGKPREPQDVDADTLRARALHDRMGSLIFSGYHVHRGRIEIRHSVRRTNAFELWVDGRKAAEGGKRKIVEGLL